jgi:hypothetical protein
MIKAKGDGVKIQLAIWEGRGKSILCIHGLTANCRCWNLIASSLTPHHRMIAVDLRGRGLSDHPPSGYSIEHHCKDLLALMDDLGLRRQCSWALLTFISLVFWLSILKGWTGSSWLTAVENSRMSRWQGFAGIKPSLDRLRQIFLEDYVSQMKQAPFYISFLSRLFSVRDPR